MHSNVQRHAIERIEVLPFLSKRSSQPSSSQLRTGLNASSNDSAECHVIHTCENTHIFLGSGVSEVLRLCNIPLIRVCISSSLLLRPPSHLQEVTILGGVLNGELASSISLAARYSLKNLPTAQATSVDRGLSNETPRSNPRRVDLVGLG